MPVRAAHCLREIRAMHQQDGRAWIGEMIRFASRAWRMDRYRARRVALPAKCERWVDRIGANEKTF